MPKVSTPFTQADINKLTCPDGRKSIQIPIDPHQVPGLLIEIRDTGSKTFFLRYRDAQNQTRYAKIARVMDMTLSDVKKQALRIRSGIVLGNYPGIEKVEKKSCPTWDEFFRDTYAPFALARKKSFKDDLKLHRKRISPRLGTVSLSEITLQDADNFLSDLAGEGLAASSIRHHGQLLKRCMGLAMKWQIIERNALSDLSLPIVRDAREYFLTNEELQRLIKAIDASPNRSPALAAKLLLLTGCRVGELLQCRWQDLTLDTDMPSLKVIREHSKNGKARYVPLSREALKVINQLPSKGISEFLFINSRNGERLKSIDKSWQALRKEAGLPTLRLHDLRHNYASMLVSSGESLYSVQKILGHSSPTLSTRYSHFSNSALHDAANSVSSYLDKALKHHE